MGIENRSLSDQIESKLKTEPNMSEKDIKNIGDKLKSKLKDIKESEKTNGDENLTTLKEKLEKEGFSQEEIENMFEDFSDGETLPNYEGEKENAMRNNSEKIYSHFTEENNGNDKNIIKDFNKTKGKKVNVNPDFYKNLKDKLDI